MTSRFGLALLLVSLCACKPPEGSHSKAIIGALLIDGRGGPPLSDSVVLVADTQIRAAGARSTIPIPSDADKIDGSSKYVLPLLIDMCDSATPQGLLHAQNAEEARSQVGHLAAQKASAVHVAESDRATVEAALQAARAAGIPVTGHISTQAGARLLVENGATSLVGMIRDTEDLDPALVARLRDLRIIVAPSLTKAGGALEVARRNTRRLFQAGVLLATASEGGDLIQEAELLSDAGIPPLDVIVAATQNSAMALHQLQQRGTVEAEKRADLLLLSANPGEDIRNLRRVALRMASGEWIH